MMTGTTDSKATKARTKRIMSVISPHEFVTVWTLAKTAKEAAEKLGISSSAASQRAIYLRKKGVKLKTFPKYHFISKPALPPIPVDDLNNIIDGLRPKTAMEMATDAINKVQNGG